MRAIHRSRDAVASALADSGLDHALEGGMSLLVAHGTASAALRRPVSDTIEEYARHIGFGSTYVPACTGVVTECSHSCMDAG